VWVREIIETHLWVLEGVDLVLVRRKKKKKKRNQKITQI
jgi:hypothetical protein